MYTIGEFSRITGLSVKTLRFYHEEGLLIPSRVDPGSGYRYYASGKVEVARVITQLRQLEFSLAEIRTILNDYNDESEILDFLESQRRVIKEKIADYQAISTSLERIIDRERQAIAVNADASSEIEVRELDAMLVAAVPIKGRYSECGRGFSMIGKNFGRHLCGKPLLLLHDNEFREEDAEFEACIPIRKGATKNGVLVKELPARSHVTLLHRGPYSEVGRSYERIFAHMKEQGLEPDLPSREVYLKGPGMIFRGNPQKYLTDIQIPVAASLPKRAGVGLGGAG